MNALTAPRGHAVGHHSRTLSVVFALTLLLSSCSSLGGGLVQAASCRDVMAGDVHGQASHAGHAGQAAGIDTARYADEDPALSDPPPAATRNWSDPAGWPDGELPAEGGVVEIATDEVVLLDVSPPALAGLLIEGALVFDRQDLDLRSDWIMVEGGLYVGSAQEPFTQHATITLTGAKTGDSGCYGSKFIGLLDGTMELYGAPQAVAWTRLSATAEAGATSIAIDDADGWNVGDEIVIASTDFYGYAGDEGDGYDRQVEERTITSIVGSQLTLDEPLEYLHFGANQTFGAGSGRPNTVLESRAEVMRLTRNVVVRSEAETLDRGSDRFRFGGHIMAMGDSRIRLDSVELSRMGQAGILLRYPVHFHLMGDDGYGSFIRNTSLHHLFNRCVTIHGTNGILLQDNAAYQTFGHCYFLEDGAERGNVLAGNLGLMARAPSEATALLHSDHHFLGPATFWITNPDNVLRDNVAASSEGSGYWYALPEHPTGPSFQIFDGENWWLRRTPLGVFDGNLAHSNASDGLHVDRGPTAATDGVETTSYRPRQNPADRDSEPVLAVFENYVGYKHRGAAAWFRGDHTVMRGALLADNAVGVTFASDLSGLEDSIVVGETANLGTIMNWERDVSDDRSLPRPWQSDFAIRGFEFYDGEVWAENVHFENFTPNAIREAAAISVLDYTAFSLSPLNHSQGLTFGPETNRVYLATRTLEDLEPKENDSNEDGYRSAVFRDDDGSVTGSAGAYVTVDNPLLETGSCSFRADWNANVCQGRYVSLTLNNRDASPSLIEPVELFRGTTPGSGPMHTMRGSPRGGPGVPNSHFRTLAPLGFDYHYDLSGAAPDHFTVEMQDIEPGDRLLVSVPFGSGTPYIYRDWWIDDRNTLDVIGSLAALRSSEDSAFYREGSRLYLLLVQQDDRDYAHLTICRQHLCD